MLPQDPSAPAPQAGQEFGTAHPGHHAPGYLARRARRFVLAGYAGVSGARRRVAQHPVGWRPGDAVPGRVVAYCADPPEKLYQLQQWLPVLERLHARHQVLLLTRVQDTHEALARLTWLPRVCLPKQALLAELYAAGDLAVALYVNNSMRNFQSLAWAQMLHVHVNHGESDKRALVSNQVKAYDRVAVAGEAGRLRHRSTLLEFGDERLVIIGRPQLDLLPPSALPPSPRRTLLYAPTWDGGADFANYSSVDALGVDLVRALLSVPDARVVYKPHPRTVTSRSEAVAEAHAEICAAIESARRTDPDAGHRTVLEADILSVLPAADLLIGDVSSVTLDYLYLRTDDPIFLCDRYDDAARLLAASPAAAAADVVTRANLGEVAALASSRLRGEDPLRSARARVRGLYFGGLQPGESVEHFIDVVAGLVERRDEAMREAHHAAPTGPAAPPAAGNEQASAVLRPDQRR